ncbi:PREDICTED: uncharacterized protein LOC109236036 [Nicotiana attenuata]|uniref:uncharacterized protein LOC109236036 n=1 Tax=Nicotiana attenuata TaxID=49451 RepID=UPI000905D1A3|nr:PREDICTED: uncharacterized protein LOC109236036 [Nicotiana attenuata]
MHFAWEYHFFTERNPFKIKKIAIETRWYKPSINTIKLNCDGAFSSTNNAVGIGGTFRNSNGDWILGYQKRTHAASPIHVELLALLEGLIIALDFKETNMEIETDSTDVITLLHEDWEIERNFKVCGRQQIYLESLKAAPSLNASRTAGTRAKICTRSAEAFFANAKKLLANTILIGFGMFANANTDLAIARSETSTRN